MDDDQLVRYFVYVITIGIAVGLTALSIYWIYVQIAGRFF